MSVRVLLAEDHDDLAALVERRMRERDWTVVRASTAQEAAKRLRGDRFDAVVLDYMLPDGTGLELLGVVRESSPATPVLFLTAHGSEDVALQALGLGASDYMQKSGAMLEELPSRVADLLARGDEARDAARTVTVQDAQAPPRRRGAAADAPRMRAAVEAVVGGDVVGAGVFDGAGAPIAALLPEGLDAALLGASLLQAHAQVGILGRLTRLAPKGYFLQIETDAGILACTTVGGPAFVAVLVKPGTTHARERLDALAERVR